ncbi:MAG TPA: adenosylcobalamin-dependent ribonucleoside-diphosphate reductase [Planctomycetota bacterium]|nr:adenosylcobalamin-dependent ribonucleoside-diphosphate reductase [Planctomycetota bacterium]HRV81344.1 adenosylcobalamin-dependent ribonucleoside-diphosphate reductase [Planctomycetota bacterium]
MQTTPTHAKAMTDPTQVDPAEALMRLEATDPPVELPDPDLTDNGRTVLARRYLKKDPDTGEVMETPRQLFWRVASHVAKGELAFTDNDAAHSLDTAKEFYSLMSTRLFMPNSPCLMNAGREMGMLSACFVLPIEDSIQGIFESIKATALIQKAGGGTGFSFSRLRPAGDLVRSSGGTTEGPLSFIQVFSKATDAIQQGAFRRGANMGVLRIDHPDIAQFITFKDDPTKINNYNVSVAVTDGFIDQLRNDPLAIHSVKNPRTGEWSDLKKRDAEGKPTGQFWTVGELWNMIIEHAHKSGEPGLLFIDRINRTNPIKNVGLIEATNPCGEQPLHAYDSCNLGSINVGLLVDGEGDESTFDWEVFKSVVHSTTRFLDDVIEVNRYPLREIDSMSRSTRRIGLGVMGFADALFKLGIPYNSPEACDFGRELMRVLEEESHLASEILAEERGVFPAWEGSEWQERGRRMRNSYTTTIAPTGTISILADCSGGIEPMFSLAFQRQVMKDTQGRPTIMREVNYVFEKAATEAGYFSEELVDRILESGSLSHLDGIPEEHQRIFVTAHDIEPEWHMRMQAAFQDHCDASISKTINFPKDATVDDVRTICELAIDLDVKGVTVYRDGCREMQPMALKTSGEATANGQPASELLMEVRSGGADLAPMKLPEIMSCLRIRQMTPFGNMHVKVSVDPQSGREREVFAQLGKGGDVANSDLEAICRMLSLWLRSNGSLEKAIGQFSGIGSSLSVPTANGRIMSLADGLATALRRYLEAKKQHGLEALLLGRAGMDPAGDVAPTQAQAPKGTPRNVGSYKIKCPACSNGNLAFQEGCAKCHSCGFSQC